jgi:hypothetical protein
MIILFMIGLVVMLMTVTFALLFWKLASRRDDGEIDAAAWLHAFSVDSYAPMERLLDKSDFEFLSSQPGYQAEIGARLIRERKRLFLAYLNHLIADFNQLLRIARFMIVHSREDRADFAAALWRQQVAFYFAICAVRVRVVFYPLGWSPLDIAKLVRALSTMRAEVGKLGFVPLPASELT